MNAGISALEGYDYMVDRKTKAEKVKRDAAVAEENLKQEQMTTQMISQKQNAYNLLYGEAVEGGVGPMQQVTAVQEENKQLKQQLARQSGVNGAKYITDQVLADDSYEQLPITKALVEADPNLTKLFGTDFSMPNPYDPTQKMGASKLLGDAGLPNDMKTVEAFMKSGLAMADATGKIIDMSSLMAASGAFKYMTPDQKAKYEQLVKSTFGGASGEGEAKKPEGSLESTVDTTNEEPTIAKQADKARVEAAIADLEDPNSDTSKQLELKGAQKLAETQVAAPESQEEAQVSDMLTKPKIKNMELLRALVGVRAAPKDSNPTTMQTQIDLATQVTGPRENYKSDKEYSDALINNLREIRFAGNGGGSDGDTATIRTLRKMTEIASNINGEYTDEEVRAAKNYLASRDPNKKTDTMRNIDYKEGVETSQAIEALGGNPNYSYTGAGTPYDIKNLGKPGTGPLVGPGGKSVPNAKQPMNGMTPERIREQVTYEKGINKDTLKAIKEDAVELPKRAQGISRLVKFRDEVKKLYKNGKMDAGYADDFFQAIGEKVPLTKTGTLDQTLANAKIKDYIVKAVTEASGKAASNQETQRQIDIITGGNGLQEEGRVGLFTQFVDGQVNSYNDTRSRMVDSKQWDVVTQADKYINQGRAATQHKPQPKAGQKVLNKRDGKYYIKQPNGKYRLAE